MTDFKSKPRDLQVLSIFLQMVQLVNFGIFDRFNHLMGLILPDYRFVLDNLILFILLGLLQLLGLPCFWWLCFIGFCILSILPKFSFLLQIIFIFHFFPGLFLFCQLYLSQLFIQIWFFRNLLWFYKMKPHFSNCLSHQKTTPQRHYPDHHDSLPHLRTILFQQFAQYELSHRLPVHNQANVTHNFNNHELHFPHLILNFLPRQDVNVYVYVHAQHRLRECVFLYFPCDHEFDQLWNFLLSLLRKKLYFVSNSI